MFGGGTFGGVSFGGVAFVPYHRELLALAAALRTEERHEMAIIAASMCCEVLTEMAISSLLSRRGVPELKEPLAHYINGFNLRNNRVLAIYEALSGDTGLNQQQFWEDYCILIKSRNEIIHTGKKADSVKSGDLMAAAQSYVNYIEARL